LDIIRHVDQLSEYGAPQVGPSKNEHTLNQWLQEVRRYHYPLAMPRWVKMGLAEFATPSAQAYFTAKKEKLIGPFADRLQETPRLLSMADEHLLTLEALIEGTPFFWGEDLSLDDFDVFASLRCLTTTQGLQFPEKLQRYMAWMSEASQVPLHWDRALNQELQHG
jgi:glutaredoxin 2